LRLSSSLTHASLQTFAHILYTLAAHPDVAELLREEAEALLDTEMSPAIMSKMVKLDSFLREVNRLHPYPNLSFLRLLRKDHTFGNGTYLPKGTMLAIPVLPHHLDADNYEDAGDFKPFRFTFSATHEAPSAQRRTFTSTDFGYLPFGHGLRPHCPQWLCILTQHFLGRNACLGRFLVDSIFKAMVCHIVLNYEIRAETTGVRPEDLYLGPVTMPKYSAKVFFRKRQE
jgi:cytochrome P450